MFMDRWITHLNNESSYKFASNLVDFLNGFIFNRDIWLTKDDNKSLGKENCKQGFHFSAKTKQSSKIDCSNNVTSNEKKIELVSNYLCNLSKKYELATYRQTKYKLHIKYIWTIKTSCSRCGRYSCYYGNQIIANHTISLW